MEIRGGRRVETFAGLRVNNNDIDDILRPVRPSMFGVYAYSYL